MVHNCLSMQSHQRESDPTNKSQCQHGVYLLSMKVFMTELCDYGPCLILNQGACLGISKVLGICQSIGTNGTKIGQLKVTALDFEDVATSLHGCPFILGSSLMTQRDGIPNAPRDDTNLQRGHPQHTKLCPHLQCSHLWHYKLARHGGYRGGNRHPNCKMPSLSCPV
jgi:hypothetical protein